MKNRWKLFVFCHLLVAATACTRCASRQEQKETAVAGGQVMGVSEEIIPSFTRTATVYTFEVDYDQSNADIIAACQYAWGDFSRPETYDDLPPEVMGKRAIDFVVSSSTTTETASRMLDRMQEARLRSAAVKELLTFGCIFPYNSRQHQTVAALGSVWEDQHGQDYFVYLHHQFLREKGYYRWEPGIWRVDRLWDTSWTFAGVREAE